MEVRMTQRGVVSPKSTSAWVTAQESWDPRGHCRTCDCSPDQSRFSGRLGWCESISQQSLLHSISLERQKPSESGQF